MTCYGQVNQGSWCQETYETKSRDAGRRTRQLRKAGYEATSSSIGFQVTRVGSVKLTMVTIQPGRHEDTFYLPQDEWKLERI
jgi:hypothetical protein